MFSTLGYTWWQLSFLYLSVFITFSLKITKSFGLPRPKAVEDDEPYRETCNDGMDWFSCFYNYTCFNTDTIAKSSYPCTPGCFCPDDKVWFDNQCIEENSCPPIECKEGTVFSTCGNYCQNTCPGILPLGSCQNVNQCHEGCFCSDGMKFFAGYCYLPEDCPTNPGQLAYNFLLTNSYDGAEDSRLQSDWKKWKKGTSYSKE